MDFSYKIKTIDEIADLKSVFKGKTFSLCHGVFDIVHFGHLQHLKRAKEIGEVLVVSITADAYVKKRRSLEIDENNRAIQLANLSMIDFVIIVDDVSAVTVIEKLQPNFYIKGDEYADLTLDNSKNIYAEKNAVDLYGGKLVFTSEETHSSTKIGYFLKSESEAVQEKKVPEIDLMFKDLKHLGLKLDDFKRALKNLGKMKVLIIGETIVDKWSKVNALGLSHKSKCTCVQIESSERQLGGASAIAKHLVKLGVDVTLVSNLDQDEFQEANVISVKNIGPIVKERFIDNDDNRSLFETQNFPKGSWEWNKKDIGEFDLCLLADFGHGFLKDDEVKILKNFAPVVVAMSQANTANNGTNLIRKHADADILFLNTREAKLELQNFTSTSSGELASHIFSKFNTKYGVSVTGGAGSSYFCDNQGLIEIPSVSSNSYETVGCGDIYLALFATVFVASGNMNATLAGAFGSIGASYIASGVGNFGSPDQEFFIRAAKIVF